jgi:hypothetical protein
MTTIITPMETGSGRQICTSDKPIPENAGGLWAHPEAVHIGTCSEGCCDDYRCPACGTEWRQECPQ